MQSHRSPNRHWNHVAFEFASRAPRARAEIAELNRLMGQVNKDLVVRQAPPPRQSHPNLHWFLDRMIHAGMADIEEGLLRLAGTRELAFAAGGWLEFRVFQAVHALLQRGIVQDLASGVQVRGPDRIAAEWDVVFLANNNLHIIECKARAGTLGNSGVGMDSLYKLEALTRLEGLSAYSMLVSLARPTETEAQRARRKGIETLTLSGNGDVTGPIERWIERINQAQPVTRPALVPEQVQSASALPPPRQPTTPFVPRGVKWEGPLDCQCRGLSKNTRKWQFQISGGRPFERGCLWETCDPLVLQQCLGIALKEGQVLHLHVLRIGNDNYRFHYLPPSQDNSR